MTRLAQLKHAPLTPEQKELYNRFNVYKSPGNSDKLVRKSKTKNQPARSSELAQHFTELATSLAKIPSMSTRAREMAIIVVGKHTRAAYEEYAHSRPCGYSSAQLDQIHVGQCPGGLSVDENVAFEVTLLLFRKGPLPRNVWEHAVDAFGVDGAKAFVHYVEFYRYIATILNGFDEHAAGRGVSSISL